MRIYRATQVNTKWLKEYYDQDGMLFPSSEIANRVDLRDYNFFLDNGEQKDFLRIVDTLQKYESRNINLDTQQGRDWVMFKRQLYQMYEVRNRSVSDHEQFSFEVERENLSWLYRANQEFIREISRQNERQQIKNASILKGAVFKQKGLTRSRLHGALSFGFAGLSFAYFPWLSQTLGFSASMLAVCASSVYGMYNLQQDVGSVRAIYLVNDDQNPSNYRVRLTINNSILSSYTIEVDPRNIQSLYTLANQDGYEESDLDTNVVVVKDFVDVSTGKVVPLNYFLLPAESCRDNDLMDWVLSVKPQSF